MKYLLRLLLVLVFKMFVRIDIPLIVIPGGSCNSTVDCVTSAVCTSNGACNCSYPYVDSTDGQTCVYNCSETLNDASNGNINGSTVTYSCDAGYNLNGAATRTCDLVTGGWTSAAPTCDEIDECTSDPCQNDGFCIDSVNSYMCLCVAGYTDTHCETDIDECTSDPCQNGATCVDDVNGYTCSCANGYTDILCDGHVDECISNPCIIGACNNNVGSYNCSCTGGYTGTNCETETDESANENGAIGHCQVNWILLCILFIHVSCLYMF